MTNPSPPDQALRDLGDRMDNAQISAAARFWQACEAQELQEHPHLREPKSRLILAEGTETPHDRNRRAALVGMVGRRFTRLMFGVLLQELSRRPGFFMQAVAGLANGVCFEVGETLQALPFEERAAAFDGLSRQLAQGLQIGLARPDLLEALASGLDAAVEHLTGGETPEAEPTLTDAAKLLLVALHMQGFRVVSADEVPSAS